MLASCSVYLPVHYNSFGIVILPHRMVLPCRGVRLSKFMMLFPLPDSFCFFVFCFIVFSVYFVYYSDQK